MSEAFENMDRMYRHQRYFYDATRKFYLFGRDKMIARMDVQPGENVLEVGCGTARNLVLLAKKYPRTNFFGLDASSEMLKTAQAKVDANKVAKNVHLEVALADDFTSAGTFSLAEAFDSIYFSYSITMIPTWRESIANALENLKSGHKIYIVDFYDQKGLPKWFQKALQVWLKRFHVQFWNELMPHLELLEKQGLIKLRISEVFRRYSFIAELTKIDQQ
ncbi:MAG TPA: class I SAM-dependent methyltransferase [Pyrinomonadaceae bacterium]|jgi:S-adenosylmethionine-diacylgycerolhomoserine-N-methlytransferase|nr:class I SAM-dependent methyltransferase [Pyrinomonadaceae bacterium]